MKAVTLGQRAVLLSFTLSAVALISFLFCTPAFAAPEATLRAAIGIDKPLGRYEPRLKKRVVLRGSRGEVVPFLLKLNSSSCKKLKTTPFRRGRGSSKLTLDITPKLYRVEVIPSIHPSYAGAPVGSLYDPLIPSGTNLCPTSKSMAWYLVELSIPRDAAAGKYKAVYKINRRNKITITLQVWRMVMPESPTFPAYAEVSAFGISLAHFGEPWVNNAALIKRYIAAMHEHRITTWKAAVDWPPLMDTPSGTQLDIFNYPSSELAFFPLTVADRPNWAYYDFPPVPADQMDDPSVAQYFQAIERTIPEINRPDKAMMYVWDEPQQQHLPQLKEFLERIRGWAPSLKIAVSLPGLREFSPYIDIFIPAIDYYLNKDYATIEDYQYLRDNGAEIWWYVSCMSHHCFAQGSSNAPDFVIDRDSSHIRTIGWLASIYDIDGFYYYNVNESYRAAPEIDVWDNTYFFGGNGDGLLFYPGRPGERGFTEHQPVVSMRLKLWRETSYDAEYIQWGKELPQRPEWWDYEFIQVVQGPAQWTKNYTAYQKLRNKIGNAVDRHLKSRGVN